MAHQILTNRPQGVGGYLSDATPAAVGTAASGTSQDVARADHVHALAAKVVVVEAAGDIANEFNLGGLTSGLLKHTVAAGVSTPATAVEDTDYLGVTYDSGIETVTTGAISVTKKTTRLSVTNTVAFTLAAGTRVGQEKFLICTVAADTPVGTVTATLLGGTTLGAFGVVGERARLIWDGAQWLPGDLSGVTVS